MERAPLKTELRRGMAPPGLLRCSAVSEIRPWTRSTRFKHGSESRLSCYVHSDSSQALRFHGLLSLPLAAALRLRLGRNSSAVLCQQGPFDSDCRGPPLAAWAASYRPRAGAGHVHVGTVTARQLPSTPLCRLAGPGCCTRRAAPPAHRHFPEPRRLAATAAVARRKGQ